MYKVVKHTDDSPVFVVAPVNSDGPERTLHRDLLLPCSFLAPSIQEEADQVREKRGKSQSPQESKVPQGEGEPEQKWESEGEVEYYYPQTAEENVTFPTITIVHEIRQARVTLTRDNNKDGMGAGKSNLNPEVDAFQLMENLERSNPDERRRHTC